MMGLLQTLVMSSALVAFVVCAFLWFVRPGVGLARAAYAPFARLVVARVWLYSVVWVPLVVLGAALLPGLWAVASQEFDHCSSHGGPHGHHLCVVHLPHAATEPWTWIVVGALVALSGAVIASFATRVLQESRVTRALVALSRPTEWGDDVRLLDGAEPLACTVGGARATILLSRGLVDRVTERQLRIVLSHERAHVRRRDVLTTIADRLAGLLLPKEASRPLLSQIVLAREQLCDDASAGEDGSRLEVAATILAVARLGVHRPCAGHCFGDGEIEARVQHLLAPAATSNRWICGILAAVTAMILLGAGPLHIAIETLTTAILH
jgi:hypothetical protein